MTNNDRPETFAERLQRIEARKNGAPVADDTAPAPPKETSRVDTPADEDVTLRNALIWMAIAIAVSIGGYFGFQALPQDLKDTLAWMTGNAPEEVVEVEPEPVIAPPPPPPPPPIVETNAMADQGPRLASPAVARTTSNPTTLAAIAQDIILPTEAARIGRIRSFDRNASCSLRTPLDSETIVNVRIETGLLPTPVQAFSAAALSDQLLQNINAVTQKGQTYDHDAQINGTLSGVDVFLTDSSAPLYVVLQNMGPGIIWNIQAAPDVTVAHVAIVSSEISGLVNVPAGATFDALLVSDFVPPYAAGDDDTTRDCMIRPWRNPEPAWIGVQKAEAGDTALADHMQSYTQGYKAYNAWFTANIGVDASTNVISLRDAAHVLHGEVPSDPITYQPMAGQDIHMMRTNHILAGDPATRASLTRNLHQQLLQAAVGGPVDRLNPAPVERASQ